MQLYLHSCISVKGLFQMLEESVIVRCRQKDEKLVAVSKLLVFVQFLRFRG